MNKEYFKYPVNTKQNLPKLIEFCFAPPNSVFEKHCRNFSKYINTLHRICFINDKKVSGKRARRFKKHLNDGRKLLKANYKIAYPYSRESY